MCKRMSSAFVLAVALFAGRAPAQTLVPNGDLELPNRGTITGWDSAVDIPDWRSTTPAAFSGVVGSAWALGGPNNGLYVAFVGQNDPQVWNLLYYKIQPGDSFVLYAEAVDVSAARDPGGCKPQELRMTLYYDENGQQVSVATQVVQLTATWTTYSLTFAANDFPGCIGKRLGVAFANVGDVQAHCFLALDNVRLDQSCATCGSTCPECKCPQTTECPAIVCRTTIEWVNECSDVDGDGGAPDDPGWTDLLTAEGYQVNVRASVADPFYWRTLDDTKIGYLNDANLVILSSLITGEDYDDGREPNQWNGVTKPLITLSAAVAMNNCWGILNNATPIDLQAPRMQVLLRSHPIFTGIPVDSSDQAEILDPTIGYRAGGVGCSGCTTFLGTTSAGNGTLIATVAGATGLVWIAEWPQVTTRYYPGAIHRVRGPRLTFFAGTQSNNPGPGIPWVGKGVYNLNPVGRRMFLNAVRHMLHEPIPDASLVGWWKLDEVTGAVAADSSGSANNGTLSGGPVWQPGSGRIDGALRFDGVDDYVDCGNAPALNIRDQITMACWINAGPTVPTPTTPPPDPGNWDDEMPVPRRRWDTILAKGDDSYRLTPWITGGVHLGLTGTSAGDLWGTTAVLDLEWHHIAGVYDGAWAMIYVDGALDAAASCTGPINASSYNLFIGQNSQTRAVCLNGLVDDVRIYNRALSPGEIAELAAPPGP